MTTIQVTPDAVLGGQENTSATVTLGAPTLGNRNVNLSCDHSGLTCVTLSFVTGQQQASASLTSHDVIPDQVVTVTASYNIPYVGAQTLAAGVLVNSVPFPAIDQGPCNDCNGSGGSPINMTNGNTY